MPAKPAPPLRSCGTRDRKVNDVVTMVDAVIFAVADQDAIVGVALEFHPVGDAISILPAAPYHG
jgi:hypothetical protein